MPRRLGSRIIHLRYLKNACTAQVSSTYTYAAPILDLLRHCLSPLASRRLRVEYGDAFESSTETNIRTVTWLERAGASDRATVPRGEEKEGEARGWAGDGDGGNYNHSADG